MCGFPPAGCYNVNMISDGELLGSYCGAGSEEAFGELVRRHLDLVYSAAVRQLNGDAHLAQDVTQSVFCDLARKARTLIDRPSLAGWLYTSTHHAASNAVRSAQRRQTHEQEAHAMQELLRNPGPELDWESFRPMLDDAMQELNESDREVILLRYFQNRAYGEIAERIGVGENGARMRAERALDKLRDVLSRRGVTATAAVAAILSANAVMAAPAGFATTVTTAATLAATAAATTTASTATIAAKTIAMTTSTKILVAAVITASIGAALYTGVHASQLGRENLSLRQQQTALTSQVQELQQQQTESSNRLASLSEENQRLASGQNTSELLKMRAQVAALRQSATSAGNGPSSSAITKMMNDPTMREYIHQQQLRMIKERYASFFKEMNLSPEDADKFTGLLGDAYLKGTDMASSGALGDPNQQGSVTNAFKDLTGEIKNLLGPDGYSRYEDYNKTIPGQALVKMLDQQLSDNSLTAEQTSQLIQVVKQQPFSSTHGIAGDFDPAFSGSQETIDAHVQQIMDSNQGILDQAASFLSSNQLSTLSLVLSNSLDAQKVQAAAFAQKH